MRLLWGPEKPPPPLQTFSPTPTWCVLIALLVTFVGGCSSLGLLCVHCVLTMQAFPLVVNSQYKNPHSYTTFLLSKQHLSPTIWVYGGVVGAVHVQRKSQFPKLQPSEKTNYEPSHVLSSPGVSNMLCGFFCLGFAWRMHIGSYMV